MIVTPAGQDFESSDDNGVSHCCRDQARTNVILSFAVPDTQNDTCALIFYKFRVTVNSSYRLLTFR